MNLWEYIIYRLNNQEKWFSTRQSVDKNYVEKFRRITYFTKCKKKEKLQINANITKNAKRTILQNIQKINYLFHFILFYPISINYTFLFKYCEVRGGAEGIFF